MGIELYDLGLRVIAPACSGIKKLSYNAVMLLLGTCMMESNGGQYLSQITFRREGPKALNGGLGIFQMEKATHDDLWKNFLMFKPDLAVQVLPFSENKDAANLVLDLRYAAMMCRVHYLRAPEGLPDAEDVLGLANYWKKYYNTPLGTGTASGFVAKYNSMILTGTGGVFPYKQELLEYISESGNGNS